MLGLARIALIISTNPKAALHLSHLCILGNNNQCIQTSSNLCSLCCNNVTHYSSSREFLVEVSEARTVCADK